MKMIGDRILIELDEVEEVTPGGIIIPDEAKDNASVYGIIVGMGPGERLKNGEIRAPEVNLCDRVVFTRGSGHSVKYNGKDHVVLKEFNILGIIE